MLSNEERRIEWVKSTLKSIPAGLKLLDAGAGEQQYRKYCSHLQYVSQDFAAYVPENVDEGLQMEKWDYGKLDIVSDILNIPVESASFDVILCTEVFEHIPEPAGAVTEFARILKPGGELIITAPFCSMTHFAPYHYYTGFNKYFYQYHLDKNGFRITEMTPSGNYFDYMSQETGRLPHMIQRNGKNLSWFQKWVLNKAKEISEREANNGADTAELMSFGWHVRAVKNPL